MVAPRKQLKDKLFYQICALQKPRSAVRASGTGGPASVDMHEGRAIYMLRPGEEADLVLHFYNGGLDRVPGPKLVEIGVDNTFLVSVGRTEVNIYPEDKSGKVQTLRLVAKRQPSQEITRVVVAERTVGDPVLTRSELYVLIRPSWLWVAMVLVFVFTGSVFNGWPGKLEDVWMLKAIGSALTAIAFWLAFHKLPVK